MFVAVCVYGGDAEGGGLMPFEYEVHMVWKVRAEGLQEVELAVKNGEWLEPFWELEHVEIEEVTDGR